MVLEALDYPTTEVVDSVVSPIMPADATPLDRCDAEIATALQAVLTGSLELEEALLYYRDWCSEPTPIVGEQRGLPPEDLETSAPPEVLE
jgi:hypothetical protein